jgi:RNA polymerase sigma-70 factor (ECF subfamily)
VASDETLMDRYAHGAPEAFEELYDRYGRRAFGFLLRRTGRQDRADDLFQELFLRLHRFRHTFRPDGHFEPWFFRIARSVLADDFRRRATRISTQPEGSQEPAGDSDPEREAGACEALTIALASLSQEERFILCAAKGECVGYEEIARELDRGVDGVKQVASRAMRRLRGTTASSPERVGSHPWLVPVAAVGPERVRQRCR